MLPSDTVSSASLFVFNKMNLIDWLCTSISFQLFMYATICYTETIIDKNVLEGKWNGKVLFV